MVRCTAACTDSIPYCRQLQLNTEDLARKAFGTRAVLVRALTQGASDTQAAACSFLLAAQVCPNLSGKLCRS